MAFRIDPGRDVLEEVRRIAGEQVDRAIATLESRSDDRTEAVHDCRKRCKKVRGLVRMVRPGLGDAYGPANETFRDAARVLSELRDAPALLRTFDHLVAIRRAHLPAGGVSAVRRRLQADADEALRRADRADDEVTAAIDLLRDGQALIATWGWGDEGFDALAGGVADTYRRGRTACGAAIHAPTTENLHEYRKQVKYTWYHLRLLRPTAPSLIKPLEDRWHNLGDVLGDDHDLAAIGARLTAHPQRFGGDDEVAAAMLLIDGQRADLQRRALPRAARLHAERTTAFTDRLRGYWDAWHGVGPEVDMAPLAAVETAGDGLEDAAADDLRRRAAELEVAGRSTMSKVDLIGAVRAGGPGRRSRDA